MTDMKIGLAQMRVRSQSPRRNFSELKQYIQMARLQGAHVLMCPEMCIPGYFVGDAWERAGFLAELEDVHAQLAAETADGKIALVFGSLGIDRTARGEDGRVRIGSALYHARRGGFEPHTRTGLPFTYKTLSPNYREFSDTRHFTDNRSLAFAAGVPLGQFVRAQSLGSPGFVAGLCLCEDGWDEDYAHHPLDVLVKEHGARALLNLSCSPFTAGKRDKRLRVFSAKARSLATPVFYVNCVGTQNVGKTVYGLDGGSFVFSSDGGLIYEGGFFREELAIVSFDPDTGACALDETVRMDQGVGGTAVTSKLARFSLDTCPTNPVAEKRVALEATLAAVCEEWNIARTVIGVSGGIDSALSACVFSRVLGVENTFLVNMPSRFNAMLTRDAARALAENLGCPFLEAPIEDSVALTLHEMKGWTFGPGARALEVTGLVRENIQARDRSARVLSALAASLGAVFPCNANKAESTVGYSTLYGDQSGFLAPLADLWKHDVYAMALHYNAEVFHRVVVPAATLDVVPSAELSDAQDVTAGKGDPLTYEFHDRLFAAWVERWTRFEATDCLERYLAGTLERDLGCTPGLIARLFPTAADFIADLERWWSLYVGMGAFKRAQAPPVVALSRRAFGSDHRDCLGPVEFSSRYLALKGAALAEAALAECALAASPLAMGTVRPGSP